MKYAKRYMAKIGSAGILLAALAATACMDHGDDIPTSRPCCRSSTTGPRGPT